MNVFILNTGRCGSTTFIKACSHINNYSCGHETLASQIGAARLDYPLNHIEADNRLSWYLGRLDAKYTDNALYVHLHRDRSKVIKSFSNRREFGILHAYENGILIDAAIDNVNELAEDYIDTVNENINFFLKLKSHKMDFNLESAKQDFKTFWELIGATGNLEAALNEWDINYNAS